MKVSCPFSLQEQAVLAGKINLQYHFHVINKGADHLTGSMWFYLYKTNKPVNPDNLLLIRGQSGLALILIEGANHITLIQSRCGGGRRPSHIEAFEAFRDAVGQKAESCL
jgi:hypothetical protein